MSQLLKLVIPLLLFSFNVSALINGQEDTYKFPGVVKIEMVRPNGNGLCTASLIATDKLLTAAHCVLSAKKGHFPVDIKKLIILYQGNKYTFFAGEFSVTVSPSFQDEKHSTEFSKSDLAIIDLKQNKPSSDHLIDGDKSSFFNNYGIENHVLPIRENIPYEGDKVYLVGYGCTKTNGPTSTVRRYGVEKINQVTAWYVDLLTSRNQVSLCSGDSGGPLIQEITDVACNNSGQCVNTLKYKIIGVASSYEYQTEGYKTLQRSTWAPIWNLKNKRNIDIIYKRNEKKPKSIEMTILKLVTDFPQTYGQDNFQFIEKYRNK